MSIPIQRRLGLALLWLLASIGIVAAAGAVFAGIILAVPELAGSLLGEVQRAVWLAFGRAVAFGALGPVLVWTIAVWLVVASHRPGLDASWGRLSAGVFAVAALGFPPVGAWLFTVWTPGGPGEWLGTLLLIAGGASAAMLLARRILPPLAPGALSGPRGAPRSG